jgi:serine/threonine/tyrosine-interacting protein
MASPLPQVTEQAMSDSITRHARSEDYVFRIPTPPRVVIPALNVWNHARSFWEPGNVVHNPDPTANVDFLQDTDYMGELARPIISGGGWRYDNRRQAQSILSYLYLGPLSAAKDKEFLRHEGITMVLAIEHKTPFGARLTSGAMKVADELGITKEKVEVAHNQELISLFPITTRIINAHLREMHNRRLLNPHGGISEGKVLVFCESGNEKSAGVAAAYLMDTFDSTDYIKACQICNQRRFCCSFDDGMKQLLKTYDDIVQAKRLVAAQSEAHGNQIQAQPVTSPFFGSPDVLASPQPRAPQSYFSSLLSNGNGRSKRGRERDVEDEDMDMDDGNGNAADDDDRFVGREFAPFR